MTSKKGRGGRRYHPYVFTEQGVAMLSSVLNSHRAVQVNIAIMRTFVRMRRMLVSHEDLARKVAALEGKYDSQFRVVFDAIRALISTRLLQQECPVETGVTSFTSVGKSGSTILPAHPYVHHLPACSPSPYREMST